MSVCLFLFCTKLCSVLGGTAGASMRSAPALVLCKQAALLPISLPTGCQRGLAEQRVQPPAFPLAVPCLFLPQPYKYGAVEVTQLAVCQPVLHVQLDVKTTLAHRQGCEPWRGAAPRAKVCLVFLYCSLQHIQIVHLTFPGFSLLDSLSLPLG